MRSNHTLIGCLAGMAMCAGMAASATEAVLEVRSGSMLADTIAEAKAQPTLCAQPLVRCSARAQTENEAAPAATACSGARPVMAWRRADELSNGDARMADLVRLASAGERFRCAGSSCLLVVPTTVPNEPASGVSTLSVCRVQVVNGVVGAPMRCDEASRERAGGIRLLRAQVGDSYLGCSMGLPDFDAVFRGRGADLAGVRRLVTEVLAGKPFNLSVMEDRGAIVGTRKQLASEVLSGWREWVTVRVDIDARNADAGTTITSTLLVGKRAAAEREAWTAALESQESAYLLALRSALQQRGADLSTGLSRR